MKLQLPHDPSASSTCHLAAARPLSQRSTLAAPTAVAVKRCRLSSASGVAAASRANTSCRGRVVFGHLCHGLSIPVQAACADPVAQLRQGIPRCLVAHADGHHLQIVLDHVGHVGGWAGKSIASRGSRALPRCDAWSYVVETPACRIKCAKL